MIIKVEYGGQWQGACTDLTSLQSWSGTGTKTVTLNRPSDADIWIIGAAAQKMDMSSNSLKIIIQKTDGTILHQASSFAQYGVAQVAYSIDDNESLLDSLLPDSTTVKEGNAIMIQSITRTNVFVQNVGNSPVTITEIYVDGDLVTEDVDYNIINNIDMQPAQTATITFTSDLPTPQVTIKVVTSDGTYTETTKTFSVEPEPTPTPTEPQPTAGRINQVIIKVEYSGQWQGVYGDQTGLISWSGIGTKTVTLNRPSNVEFKWIISANAQKMDGQATL